jgi:hypothetical protein
MNTCKVVIPVYKKLPSEDESFSISYSLPNLLGFDICLLAPQSLNTLYYEKKWNLLNCIRFSDKYFTSTNAYSELLMSPMFYEKFLTHDYILILQPDAIVLKPELQQWVNRGYDYIGAPWKDGFQTFINLGTSYEKINPILCSCFVGNGGLSLRKSSSCISLINEFKDVAQWWASSGSAEDLFFSFIGNISLDFKIPNLMTAAHFSHETDPEYMYSLINKKLPFGVHAWEKYSREHWESLLKVNQ